MQHYVHQLDAEACLSAICCFAGRVTVGFRAVLSENGCLLHMERINQYIWFQVLNNDLEVLYSFVKLEGTAKSGGYLTQLN